MQKQCPRPVMTETPSGALEHRVSELEQLVGNPADGGAKAGDCVLTALRQAYTTLTKELCPVDTEDRLLALRHVNTLHSSNALVPIPKGAIEAAGQRVDELERGLRELDALLPVLDGPWRQRGVLGDEAREAVRKVSELADEAERRVEEESRAVDAVLTAYNARVERTNRKFAELTTLLQAVEDAARLQDAAEMK